jgi:3'5'-cyclic nucleotide phosphodiesterase
MAMDHDPDSFYCIPTLTALSSACIRFSILLLAIPPNTSSSQNPFHNFEHASHVTMSVSKLLSRIVAPDIEVDDSDNMASNLHDHTYGITSDPLTQFSVVISALVHDVDHVGLPNFLLSTENKTLADVYKNKSIAEQNSVDVAWDTLMEGRFTDLRACIYSDTNELNRFRQLIANTVLATDIFDQELSLLRKKRWEMAFSGQVQGVSKVVDTNRKATIGTSILKFLRCSESQIISPSHRTISFFILLLL